MRMQVSGLVFWLAPFIATMAMAADQPVIVKIPRLTVEAAQRIA